MYYETDVLDEGTDTTAMVIMRTGIIITSVCGLLMVNLPPANARPDTRTMSCKQLQSFIEQRGSVVMNTSNTSYAQFVHHRGYCGPSEVLIGARAPVKGGGSCALKQCTERRGRSGD